jgi:hypothetical protein
MDYEKKPKENYLNEKYFEDISNKENSELFDDGKLEKSLDMFTGDISY